MHELRVELEAKSYPIAIGRDLPTEDLHARLRERETICLVDGRVSLLHTERLDALLPGIRRIEIPDGEGSKRLPLVEELAERLIALGLGRDGRLIAVGGGVTGDLTGFLAACYFRGIPFIQVPTTLLAQVDASVGGKVAVNLPGAKNSLGFFHQPEAVFTELAFLDTLPQRERAAGFAEMAKMGAILDADFLGNLGRKAQGLLGGIDLEEAIATSCLLKARVVARDEEEGHRQLLNFGHSLGHAIEGYQPKPDMLHGEAVAVGMCFALALGESIGVTAPGLAARMEDLLVGVDLPTRVPEGISSIALREIMDRDKKNRGRAIRMVMVKDWGIAEYGVEVDETALLSALAAFCQPA